MTAELVRYAASLPEKTAYAEHLACSGLLPDVYRRQPANVLYAIEYGETIGIGTMAAITGVHIIKGKPTASSGLIGALVRRAGHKLRVTGDGTRAVAIVVRADDPEFEFRSEWTLDRAVTAGLCELRNGKPWARDKDGKPTSWEKYPAAMLKARAITEVARDACEEVLFGLHYTPEELGAEVDEDGEVLERRAERVRPAAPADDEWSTPAPAPQPAEVIEDAEVVDEPEGATPAPEPQRVDSPGYVAPNLSPAQSRNMHRLFKMVPILNSDDRVAYCERVLRYELPAPDGHKSTNHLTPDEASAVITALKNDTEQAEKVATAIGKLIDDCPSLPELQEIGQELGRERDKGTITPQQANSLTDRWLVKQDQLRAAKQTQGAAA